MSTHDDDLRALLHETADGITPHGSLEEITARTGAARRRGWVLPSLAAAAATALVLGGVGWALRGHDDKSHAGPATAPLTREVPIYYVGDTGAGPRLFAEQTRITSPDGVSRIAMQAAQDAVSGNAADPDYRSPWPAGTTIQGLGGCLGKCDIQVTFEGASIANRPPGMSDQTARLAIDQLVRTVQAAWGYDSPVFFVSYTASDNKTVQLDHLLGVDITTPGSLTPASDNAELAPVQIISPANGAVLPAGTVTVTGVASTFEANVVWEVRSGTTVVKHGFTTAAECCTLSPYRFTVDLGPGTYTIVAHDTDESGQGRPVDSDTKEIVVR